MESPQLPFGIGSPGRNAGGTILNKGSDSFLIYSTVAWLGVDYYCPLILFLFIQLERVMLHSFIFLYLIIS